MGCDGDCNDSDADIYPGAGEAGDLIDNDCDGLIDDADSDVDSASSAYLYLDSDVDGFGDPGSTQNACSAPDGYVSTAMTATIAMLGLIRIQPGLPIQMVTRSVTQGSHHQLSCARCRMGS